MKAFLIAIITLIVIAGAYTVFTNGQKQQPVPQKIEEVKEVITRETKTFEIEGKPFEFSMKEIRVKQGDMVKIVFKNMQGFHDLTIDGLNLKTKQIQAGQEDSIEFVADKAGTFDYFCSVGTHREMGMVGKLIVE